MQDQHQNLGIPLSSQLFYRALHHEPRSAAALLGLAASFEKQGGYTEAIGLLEQLVEAEPGSAEGRLRLAVNLDRVGLRQRAQQLYSEIVEADARDWTCSLAYLELARGRLAERDLQGAAQGLEQAVARMSERTGPRHLLAYVYDRLGRTAESMSLLREIQSRASTPSARRLYDLWPTEAWRLDAGWSEAPLLPGRSCLVIRSAAC